MVIQQQKTNDDQRQGALTPGVSHSPNSRGADIQRIGNMYQKGGAPAAGGSRVANDPHVPGMFAWSLLLENETRSEEDYSGKKKPVKVFE